MPLIRLSAEQAIENRKTNRFGNWGDRASPNRVEPVTKPGFDVPFKIQPRSKIFTVGSCFARNVEEELERRGFDLPMRRVMLRDAPTAILNNYATPSIYNEFAWAFGEKPFLVEQHLVELQPGKFADLHLSPTLRPEPLERVMERRRSITAAYRQSAECPVVIMTLGVVEVWYDKLSGCYLNVSPRPSHLRNEPGRFEMHVLSFEEAYDYLERAILLLKKHGLPDVQLLLTVSPVPLVATHRQADVIVANCYSKSMLRAAAETLVAKYEWVTYYPSYESVTLSDRRQAWREDFVHVSHEIVALNVGRMVDAFVGGAEDAQGIEQQIEAGGVAVAVEKAGEARTGSRQDAAAFFDKFYPRFSGSAEFVTEFVQFLIDADGWDRALEVLDAAPEDMADLQTAMLRARVLVKLGKPRHALDTLEAFASRTNGPKAKMLRPAPFWHALLDTAIAVGDESIVTSVAARLAVANPVHTARGYTTVGRWFYGRGQLDRAIEFLQTAVGAGESGNRAYLPLAEALIAAGRRDEARVALGKAKVVGIGMVSRVERTAALLGDD